MKCVLMLVCFKNFKVINPLFHMNMLQNRVLHKASGYAAVHGLPFRGGVFLFMAVPRSNSLCSVVGLSSTTVAIVGFFSFWVIAFVRKKRKKKEKN